MGEASGDPKSVRHYSFRRLTLGALLNLSGQVLPLAAGLFAIPLILNHLGTDRFGMLTLIWALIGYFGLFDLGLGRALTQAVAEKLGSHSSGDIPRLVWTGLLLLGALGVIGSAVAGALTSYFTANALQLPAWLRVEAKEAFYVVAASLPAVIVTSGLSGVLVAYQRFDILNMVRIPMGVAMFVAPLFVVGFSAKLPAVAWAVAVTRIVFMLFFFAACLVAVPALRHAVRFHGPSARMLARFGGWMTVTNIVGPLMVYLDRFLIGASGSPAAVAYYATPYEIVTRLWLIPGALSTTIFPMFAAAKESGLEAATQLVSVSMKLLAIVMAPVMLLIIVFAHEGLYLWLGGEFADRSTRVLQWLAAGVYLNSLTHVPFAMVQGMGRSDLTAKLHLAELPVYLLVLNWLFQTMGILGVAIAWTARVAIDALLVTLAARVLAPELGRIMRTLCLLFLLPLLFFLCGAWVETLYAKVILSVCGLLGSLSVAFWLLPMHWREDLRRQGQKIAHDQSTKS